MIDIRAVAKGIAELKMTDPASRQAAIHAQVRNYGVELLMSIANAIQPTKEDEYAAVSWLKNEVAKIAAQIPEPLPPKKKEPTS